MRSRTWISSAAIALGIAGDVVRRRRWRPISTPAHLQVAREIGGVALRHLQEDDRLALVEAVVFARLPLLAVVLLDRPLVGPMGDDAHAARHHLEDVPARGRRRG